MPRESGHAGRARHARRQRPHCERGAGHAECSPPRWRIDQGRRSGNARRRAAQRTRIRLRARCAGCGRPSAPRRHRDAPCRAGASFSYSLMLQPTVTREDIRFSFTWQMIAGLASAAAMYAAAPWLAGFFGDARVEGMVQLLSLASLLMAAAAPATYLLQRD